MTHHPNLRTWYFLPQNGRHQPHHLFFLTHRRAIIIDRGPRNRVQTAAASVMATYTLKLVSPALSEPFTISFKQQMGHQQLTVARPSQDRLDIVATQGAYLVPRSHTPVFEEAYDETFAAALDEASDTLNMIQQIRRAKYHEAADEWPIGFTPPEVKERRLAELRAIEEMEDVTSDEGSDRDEGGDAIPDGKARVEKGRPATERAS